MCITRKTDLGGGFQKVYRAYKVDLKNKSIRFINEFNLKCSRVLGRKGVRVAGPNHEGHYQVQYCSKTFVLWWFKQGFLDFRGIIEAFPVEYLRGRYDSDCNVNRYAVYLFGVESQRDLMEFERDLCKKLGMRVGRMRPYGKPGEIYYTGSKRIVSREQKLRFSVNIGDFLSCVKRLNVEWRDQKLRQALKVRKWAPWPQKIRKKALQLKVEFSWKLQASDQ